MPPSPPPPARPRLRAALRVLRKIGVGLLGLVVILVAGLLVYLRDLDGKVRATLLERTAELEGQIGRHVTIGPVHVAVGMIPEIVVRDVTVGPAPGAVGELAVPLLHIEAVHLAVALGPLIRSGGSAIEVTRFHVESPEVNLIRSPEGISTDDVRARLAALPPGPPPGKQHLALRSLALRGGKLRLHELGGDGKDDVTLEQVALTGHDVTLDAPSRLSLTAALLGPAPNVTVELDLAPVPSGAGLELRRADLHAGGVRLGPALRWAHAAATPGGVVNLEDAELDAAVTVVPGPSIAYDGKLTLARARLAGGAPTTLALTFQAAFDPAAGTLAVPSFALAIGAVSAHGTLSARELAGTPALEALQLDASGDAAAFRDLLPADRLPPASPRAVRSCSRSAAGAAPTRGTSAFSSRSARCASSTPIAPARWSRGTPPA